MPEVTALAIKGPRIAPATEGATGPAWRHVLGIGMVVGDG